MLSVIGAGFIICGTAAWGLMAVARLKSRAKILSAFIASLELMASELSFRLTVLPELVGALAEKSRSPVSSFYSRCLEEMPSLGQRSFRMIWCGSLDGSPELLLREDEQAALEELGAVLGRFDLNQQQRAIHYCKARLSSFLSRAEAERDKQSRLYGTLGIASGVMAVLILL